MQQNQDEHEIRVKAHQPAKNYINRAATLLLRDQQQLEEGQVKRDALDYVVFKASGVAIHTALVASDIIRRKIPGLHQINKITNLLIKDVRRKRSSDEQDGDEEYEKQLVVFEILLHRNPSQAQRNEAGYIGTLPEDEQKDLKLEDILYRRQQQQQQGGRYQGNRDNNNRNYNRRGSNSQRRRHHHNNNDRDNQVEPRRRFNEERRQDNRDNNRSYRKHSGDQYRGRENNRRQGGQFRENQGNNRRRYNDNRNNNRNNNNNRKSSQQQE